MFHSRTDQNLRYILRIKLDFTKNIFEPGTKPLSLSTTHLTKSSTLLQKYKITGIQESPAPKMVACQSMPYPYAVFYCHYNKSKSRLFSVSLSGENGDKIGALAVCHMDKSTWNQKNVAFRVFGSEVGSTVCHFFRSDNLVWVPNST